MGLPVNATANFQESNESGVLSGVWEINTFGSGSVKQSTAFGGSLGSTSMVMRSSLDGADYFSMIDYLRDDFFQVEQDFFKDTAKGQMGALSEAILHLDLSGQTEDVFLSFSAKQTVNISNLTSSFSNDMQEPMSQVFTGHEAADGVALSVDGGITWYRIRSLVDEYIGQNFVSSKVNLSQLANQYGLQLGSNVQIKFQQFDSLGSTDSSGDFTFFNPERKTVSPVGTSHIQTNAIILDNIQVFTNQGPSLTLTAGQTPYRSGAPAVIIDAGASVEDPETPNFDGAVLTVSIVANGTGSDRVEILPQTGVGTGLITLQSNRVLHGGAEIGTFTGGTLGQPLRITFNLNTSPTVVQKVIRQIAFRTTSTSLLDRSVQFQLTDGQGGTSATAIKVIDMQVGGNTAPVITLSPESLMISRAAAPVPIEAGAIVEDSDSANFDGGKLTIKITTNANSSDRIEVRHQGNGAGQIGVSGSIIKYQGVQIGTLSGSTSSRIISLNANATVAAVQALMQNITFRTISSTAPVSTRTVQFQLTDGDGGTSAVANKAVNVVTKNTAPVLTVGSTIPVFRVTPGTAILIDSAATVTDADSTNFAGGQLTVRISAAATTNDRLTIRNQGPSTGQITVSGSNVLYGGIIIGTYSGGTGTAALVVNFNQNATAAATRALVRNITFSTTGSSTATTQRRTLTLQLTDGDGGTSKAVTKRIDVKLK